MTNGASFSPPTLRPRDCNKAGIRESLTLDRQPGLKQLSQMEQHLLRMSCTSRESKTDREGCICRPVQLHGTNPKTEIMG